MKRFMSGPFVSTSPRGRELAGWGAVCTESGLKYYNTAPVGIATVNRDIF